MINGDATAVCKWATYFLFFNDNAGNILLIIETLNAS